MKDLSAYMKGLYVSLENIDESLKDKIQNLDGYKINECCSACLSAPTCGCDDCEICEPTCSPEPKTAVSCNQFGRFNSECEITHELDSQPKVNTLYEIHAQFGRFNFINDVKRMYVAPLYFGHKEYDAISVNRENGDMPDREADSDSIEQLYDVATQQNKKIFNAVNDIVDTFDLRCPVIQTKLNGEVQVYAIKNAGTNGEENSIKSSLEEIAKMLGKLDSRNDIQWSQVLDVSIDNIDDLYAFVLTFVFDLNKVRETIKQQKI